jgi:drug/metabolite transporter (DMT)-like permease
MTGSTTERRRTALLLAIAVLANSFGNLLLAIATSQLPAFKVVSFGQYALDLLRNPFLLPGAVLTATYAIVQLSLFSLADLSFVVPCIASSYIVSTLLAEFVLKEHVEVERWIGVLLICFGVFLVAKTPLATKEHHPRVPG